MPSRIYFIYEAVFFKSERVMILCLIEAQNVKFLNNMFFELIELFWIFLFVFVISADRRHTSMIRDSRLPSRVFVLFPRSTTDTRTLNFTVSPCVYRSDRCQYGAELCEVPNRPGWRQFSPCYHKL